MFLGILPKKEYSSNFQYSNKQVSRIIKYKLKQQEKRLRQIQNSELPNMDGINYQDVLRCNLEKCYSMLKKSNYYNLHGIIKRKDLKRFKRILKCRMRKHKFNGKKLDRNIPKNKRIKVKNPNDYCQYLKSKHWIKRRAKYWKTHSRICFCCNNYADNLHHRIYQLYNEQDNHFVPLCKVCHKEVHKLVKSKKAKLVNAHLIYKDILSKSAKMF
jgi:hypothetical protein